MRGADRWPGAALPVTVFDPDTAQLLEPMPSPTGPRTVFTGRMPPGSLAGPESLEGTRPPGRRSGLRSDRTCRRPLPLIDDRAMTIVGIWRIQLLCAFHPTSVDATARWISSSMFPRRSQAKALSHATESTGVHGSI